MIYANKDVVAAVEELNKRYVNIRPTTPSNHSDADSELLMRDTNGFETKIINEVPQE